MSTDDHIQALAASIATAVEAQLSRYGTQSVLASPERPNNATLRLEGFLSTDDNDPRQIHLGVLDLSTLHVQTPQSTRLLRTNDSFDHGEHSEPLPTDVSPSQTRLLRTRRARSSVDSSGSETASGPRKATGGLRLAASRRKDSHLNEHYHDSDPEPLSSRRMEPSDRQFPQRKKRKHFGVPPPLQPTSLRKLTQGVWETIYGGISFDLADIIRQWDGSGPGHDRLLADVAADGALFPRNGVSQIGYSLMNSFCRKITQASRCSRALEVVVQARWVECFDARVQTLMSEAAADVTLTKIKMTALKEACHDFGWSEKEMRNKMAVWRGYKDLKDAGGWVVLVFAGMGIYRFCKYRSCFNDSNMQELKHLQQHFEVAADTLHPNWRQLLSVVGESSERRYTGHHHDWVITDGPCAVPLRSTYLQCDPNFSYEHLDSSIIDGDAWQKIDPRAMTSQDATNIYICALCNERQAADPRTNSCQCFPNLYGGKQGPCPAQVFKTPDGRDNGLVARLPFERGSAIGEYVGLVTKALQDTDVMQGQTDHGRYQIWQGRQGNFTKFVNHSCVPNSQFERFSWLGTQRIVLVSKGVDAGDEITVDYSDEYWRGLDKICLCGSSTCRYKRDRSPGD